MTIQDKTTYRHPRTLQEAFGPYTSYDLQPISEHMHMADKIILWGCSIVVVLTVVLVIAGILK